MMKTDTERMTVHGALPRMRVAMSAASSSTRVARVVRAALDYLESERLPIDSQQSTSNGRPVTDRTGDNLYFDEDGFFWFAGRDNDMFKVKGMWVTPIDIEAALTPVHRQRVGVNDLGAGQCGARHCQNGSSIGADQNATTIGGW